MIVLSICLLMVAAFFEAWGVAVMTHWYNSDKQEKIYVITAIMIFLSAFLTAGGAYVLVS